MKIDSCIIIKNEDLYIKRLLDNLLKFSDDIYIVDTGSTDNSVNIVKEEIKKHSNIHLNHFEWVYDFSAARNYSINLSENSDYIFWCDASDDFNDALIQKLIDFKNDKYNDDLYDSYAIMRQYGHLKTPIMGLIKNNIGIQWKDRVHEYLDLNYRRNNEELFCGKELLIHEGIKTRKEDHKNRNIDIFVDMEYKKAHFSSRNLLFYGNELFEHQRYISAMGIYMLAKDNYDNFLSNGELVYIFCQIWNCYNYNSNQFLGLFDRLFEFGRNLYNNGVRHNIFSCVLAECYLYKKDIYTAIRLYEESLSLRPEECVVVDFLNNDPNEEYILLQLVASYTELNKQDIAKQYNDKLLKKYPNNEIGKRNDIYFQNCLLK